MFIHCDVNVAITAESNETMATVNRGLFISPNAVAGERDEAGFISPNALVGGLYEVREVDQVDEVDEVDQVDEWVGQESSSSRSFK